MTEFEVIFYEKENGDCPVEEFIASLDVKMRAKMVGLLELSEEKGKQLREPYSKPIDDGIFEIRCKVGNNITSVLTNGFIKKTQKTPPEEIKLANKSLNSTIPPFLGWLEANTLISFLSDKVLEAKADNTRFAPHSTNKRTPES